MAVNRAVVSRVAADKAVVSRAAVNKAAADRAAANKADDKTGSFEQQSGGSYLPPFCYSSQSLCV